MNLRPTDRSGKGAALLALLIAAFLALPSPADAVPDDNNTRRVYSGGVTDLGRSVYVGHNGTNNVLEINSGATVNDGSACIGHAAPADGNLALVTGRGSAWNHSGSLTVGKNGSYNRLLITSGGQVACSDAAIGENPPGHENEALVSGADSRWTIRNVCQVRHGSLWLDGGTVSARSVSVLEKATLGGRGTVSGTTLCSGSLLPGRPIGTLTFNGALTLSGRAVSGFEFGGYAPGSEYDSVMVNGALSLGGTLNLSFVNGFAPRAGDRFVIMTASSVSGGFSAVGIANGPADLKADVVVDATTVTVVFGPGDGGRRRDPDDGGDSPGPEISLESTPEGKTIVEFESASNNVYTLEYSQDINPKPAWSNVVVEVEGMNGLMKLIHENPSDHGFYRVKVKKQ